MSLRGAMGTRRRRREVGPTRMEGARGALLADGSLLTEDRELLARMDITVDPRDAMHAGDPIHYLSVGLSAIRACRAAGVTQARRILDLPCGHGRVLRALAAAFPAAELTVCDLDRHGVDFCARQFGARPVYSSEDLDALELPGGFDLIWCGSLATHLDEGATKMLLAKLCGALAPEGTLVITTHGEFVAERIARRDETYQLDENGIERLLAGYRASGFGYADYPWSPGYGVSVAAPERMGELAPLPLIHVSERGWDRHQDVLAYSTGQTRRTVGSRSERGM
jgi:SAM-dependent methyltransferase